MVGTRVPSPPHCSREARSLGSSRGAGKRELACWTSANFWGPDRGVPGRKWTRSVIVFLGLCQLLQGERSRPLVSFRRGNKGKTKVALFDPGLARVLARSQSLDLFFLFLIHFLFILCIFQSCFMIPPIFLLTPKSNLREKEGG